MNGTISIGDKIDSKYQVTARLGMGGFGEVYLAEDVLLGRQVAIKLLRNRAPERQDDLIHEMRSLDQLQHSSIVGFYHHFAHDDLLFLVMEFCPGGSLREKMRQHRPELHEVMQWGKDLSATLEFVHKRGIVHHDIKPDNILFTSDGRLKIGDFGVANRLAGTAPYLAPEMFLGAVDPRDVRVDVYALGVTLLELLLNQSPFQGLRDAVMLAAKIRHQFIPSNLDRWIQDVLSKATHPTPELRFQSMQEFWEAIDSKHVNYAFDRRQIQAHALAAKAERHLERKQIASAAKCIHQALFAFPDCVAALIASGRLGLHTNHILEARRDFDRALLLNPRASIQKELGWLCLEGGNYSQAISMLTDYLQRNAADYEAFNLLLECFYKTERYEVGRQIAELMMDEGAPSNCFENNGFLCSRLAGLTDGGLVNRVLRKGRNPFVAYNSEILKSCQGKAEPQLLFEPYRCGLASQKENTITIEHQGHRSELKSPLITVGRLDGNLIVLTDNSVSRKHCVIANYLDDVWLYDLGSTQGVLVDGKKVDRKVYLGGVHIIRLGNAELTLSSKLGLLV